jgi:Xaa-Pro aminopeptidase
LQAPPDHTAIAPQLERRRAASAAEWDLSDAVVLVGAGDPIPIPGRGDPTYPFRAHSEYFYLTDRNRPGGVLAFDPQAGWFDFVQPVTQEEILWSGAPVGEQDGLPLPELEGWLAERRSRPIAYLGVPPDQTAPRDVELEADLRFKLCQVRIPKDEVELARMREAERATSAGFAAIVPLIEEGRSERDVQIELEAAFLRNGADMLAFETIVASGSNSAVLHFPPTHRRFGPDDLVLIDAGGECGGYASDITRTYPVGGSFSGDQEQLYDLVRAAGIAATERCLAGTRFKDVHLAASRVIAEGLTDFGVLRGDPDDLIQQGTVALFFPHSVGHLVGLGVRDAGGLLPNLSQEQEEVPKLRINLDLRPGLTLTIEPGIYFVRALLSDAETRATHRERVDWDAVDRMLDFGGIRIEDNVLVTEDGYEVLTRDVPVIGESA